MTVTDTEDAAMSVGSTGWEVHPDDQSLVSAFAGDDYDEATLMEKLRERGWNPSIEATNKRIDPFGPEWKARISIGRPSIRGPYGEGRTRLDALTEATAIALRWKL